MTANRIQRWALTLSGYNYTLGYRPGPDHGDADCMSRLPLSDSEDASQVDNHVMLVDLDNSPVTCKEVRTESRRDPILSKVIDAILSATPLKALDNESFKPFAVRNVELTVQDNCLLWGCRVVIPSSLRKQVLNELHQCHPGVNRMKMLARSFEGNPF